MFRGQKDFLFSIALVLIVQDIRYSPAALPVPNGVKFVGVGYDILKGNPEGGDLGTGGVDPGIYITRRMFKFTYDQGKISDDELYRIPDEVVYEPRNSAFTTSSLTTFYGTQSYASKLSAQVDVSGGYQGILASVQFAASARYQRVSEETSQKGSVFLSNETITNLGRARYQTSLAATGKYLLEDGFVADACRLPTAYSEANYMQFLEDWGTHVITKVDLGIREGENFVSERSSFVNYAAQEVGGSVSASGGYGGFSASLSVDMESFSSSMSSAEEFGSSSSKYTVGSESLNEPIKLELIAMPDVFGSEFWTGLETYQSSGHCSADFDRESVKTNMVTALEGYAGWKKIQSSTNPEIRIPMTWPEGEYTLPKGIRGCPNTEFEWSTGHIIHGTSTRQRNSWSNINLDLAGWWTEMLTRQEFCTKPIKTISQKSKWQFQPGSYCVFQYGPSCPQGFESGFIHWGRSQEEKLAENMNEQDGMLPTGDYGLETEIRTCCRKDGYAGNPIFLPTDDRFVLLARFDRCQQVHGMKVQKEWMYWEPETPSSESEEQHPFNGLYNKGKGIRLIYCYYYTGDLDRRDQDVKDRVTAMFHDMIRISISLQGL